MFSSLRYRLIFGFSLVIGLFASGVMLSLIAVWQLGERTELLVDRHLTSHVLISKAHNLMAEVAIFISQSPEDRASIDRSRSLQERIDQVVAEIGDSDFRDDFQNEQQALRQLSSSLSGPVELLNRLDERNREADAAFERLLQVAERLHNDDLAHYLTVAVLAYRDFSVTANPSDLEIFRQQLPRISRALHGVQSNDFQAFARHGESIFAERLRLRSSRDEILSQVAEIARKLRESRETYQQRVLHPLQLEVISSTSSITAILLLAVVAGGLASLAVALILARRFSLPMEQAVTVLSGIEERDFTVRFTAGKDAESERLGQAINSLSDSLSCALKNQEETMQRLLQNKARFREIAEERLELERIINASPTIVFFIRLQGEEGDDAVAFMSQNIQQLGYTPDDFLGANRTLISIVHPADVKRVSDTLATRLADPASQSFSIDLRLIDAQGSPRLMDGRILVQRDADGKALGYQGVLVDETEKNRMREQAEQLSNLAALGELAAGVAHEINNPNATILLNIALLKDLGESSLQLLDQLHRERGDFQIGRLPYARARNELPRIYNEIGDSAERIRRIVDDMKTFSRRSPDHARQTTDINEIAAAAIRLTGNIIKNSTDHFRADLAEGLPTVEVNRQQLEQVTVNLLINACQALSSRNEEVLLRTYLAPDGAVALAIVDSGCGIPPENLPHVTDPFFTTRRERGGTGLGLSISARIVHDHGGRILIESPGKGTVVSITLPPSPQEIQS